MTQSKPAAQAAGNGSATSPPPASTARPTLPDRAVTEATMEDAYVRFIFYCNPALPPNLDTESLREAFRNPPRSGGKVFNTFTVYELVKQFYDKEIKTWTELTTRLGVEPPDPSKDESAQKIAQYGVRLKKWMNSMHVKSFFEYLMSISNDYWTQLPSSPNPTALPMRDGVAVEDDMALRALLPHIRPKRGRKRPDGEDNTNSPAQRQRLSPSYAVEEYRQGASGPWSAQPDGQGAFLMDPSKQNGASWSLGETVQTPLTKWPHSAITPTTRDMFWDDPPEPRSAVTGSKPKLTSQRRGAKNVSSAWKPGGLDSSGKTRGRPPINRTPVEVPTWSHPSWGLPPTQELDSANSVTPISAQSAGQDTGDGHPPPRVPERTVSAPVAGTGKQARPSISLQVPERQGGAVRLATPPPVVMVNGEHRSGDSAPEALGEVGGWDDGLNRPTDPYDITDNFIGNGTLGREEAITRQYETMEDRTNVESLVGWFVDAAFAGDWIDADGNPAEQATVEECTAVVNTTMKGMAKRASSAQAFLLNVAALAGAQVMKTGPCRCRRMAEDREGCLYTFNWQYQFGSFKGEFNLAQHVPWSTWRQAAEEDAPDAAESLTAEDWQGKYQTLKQEMAKRDKELLELRRMVMASLADDATGR